MGYPQFSFKLEPHNCHPLNANQRTLSILTVSDLVIFAVTPVITRAKRGSVHTWDLLASLILKPRYIGVLESQLLLFFKFL